MELGLTSFAETHVNPLTGDALPHGERLRNVVTEIDMAASSPVVTLAAGAACTKRIRLSSAVIVLSSADPVRTFQDFATLDLLSSGRAELMVGRGSFIESFPLFGYSLSDYDDLFSERLDLLLHLRDNEFANWSGRFRAPLEGQPVYPRPYQDPLPVWIAVGGTPASIVRAGQLGLPVALAISGGDAARFSVLADLYRRTLTQSGFDPADFPLAVHGLGHVADDHDEAVEAIYPGFAATMTRIGRERGWPPLTRPQFDGMASPGGSIVVGDPETVVAKILFWKEILGIERFMLHSAGNLSHAENLRSIELLGTKVSPLIGRNEAAS